MKTCFQTVVTIIALNLVAASFVVAQDDPTAAELDQERRVMEAQRRLIRERTALARDADREARAAEQAKEKDARRVEDVQHKQLMDLLKVIPPIPPMVGQSPALAQGSGAGRVLVIPAAQTKPEQLITTMEDMTVMSRILDRKLEDEHLVPRSEHGWRGIHGGYGNWTFGIGRGGYGGHSHWGEHGTTQGIYLEGYGALFLIRVDFPLSAAGEVQEEEPAQEPSDPVWEQTRQEMYRPRGPDAEDDEDDEEQYDADKVEDLKETVIETLRHAANIRDLKPDEWVIATVTGSGKLGRDVSVEVISHRSGQILVHKDNKVVSVLRAGDPLPTSAAFRPPAVMTIRVRKVDVDALAKDDMDFDEFRQKVQIILY